MKILLVGSEFHARGRTDMTKLIVALRNLANAPKNDTKLGAIRSYRVNIFDTALFIEIPGSFGMGVFS
jgi:hypothetical protein